MMKRRQFIKSTVAAGVLAPALGFKPSNAQKSHLITFSFDDGFRKSFIKLAEIHEDFKLPACLNVIASGHMPDFKQVDDWILPELMGDFDLWNNLSRKGHEIMPHSWKHSNLAKLDPYEAKKLIAKCIAYFNENLVGFNPERSVFNFPFNSSNDDLDQYTLSLVRAVRTRGDGGINPLPSKNTKYIIGCTSNGPQNNDDWVGQKVDEFLAMDGGWLVFNLHGLDNEGWGPVSEPYFIGLLERLVSIKNLEIIPTGKALDKYVG